MGFFSRVLNQNAATQFQQDILKDPTRIAPGETDFSFKFFFQTKLPQEKLFLLNTESPAFHYFPPSFTLFVTTIEAQQISVEL